MAKSDSAANADPVAELAVQSRRSVGVLTHALFLTAMLYTFWVARLPSPWGLFVVAPAWGLLGLYWLVRLVWHLNRQPRSARTTIVHWIFGPVIAGVTIIAVCSGLPLRIAFQLSRPAFNRLAADAVAGKPFAGPQWAGLYHVTKVTYDKDLGGPVFILLEDQNSGFYHEMQPARQNYGGLSLGGGWRIYSHWPT